MNNIQPVIITKNLTKSFGEITAVRGLSLTVNQGEVFGLLGPNGAGKTTTIRMILDILKPDTGGIAVLGAPITDATKNHIGYLPEGAPAYGEMPVASFLKFCAAMRGLRGSDADKAIDFLLTLVQDDGGIYQDVPGRNQPFSITSKKKGVL